MGADFHTYFVGCDEWGFSVWAHNTCYGDWLKAHKLRPTDKLKEIYDAAVARKLTPEIQKEFSREAQKQFMGIKEGKAWNDLLKVELENMPKGRALTEADSKVLKDWLEGADGYGGRWGSKEVRELNHGWAQGYEDLGYEATHGAGRANPKNLKGSEERFIGPEVDDVTYVDITLAKGNKTVRIQTVDTFANGTLEAHEVAAVARIRAVYPNDGLVVVSKRTGKVIETYGNPDIPPKLAGK